MSLKLYVGNLHFEVSEEMLQQLFNGHGKVESVSLMLDRDTQRSKGFAFIEMSSSSEAQAAIQALNGKEFQQRILTVNEARPREERSASIAGDRNSFRPNFRSNNQRSSNQRRDKKGPSKRARRQRR